MNDPFLDFYGCPEGAASFALAGSLSTEAGYFRLGEDVTCFGRCSAGYTSGLPESGLYDALNDVSFNHSSIRLPFDLTQTVENLRLERYMPCAKTGMAHRMARRAYYSLRPLLSIPIRKPLQKLFLRGWETLQFPHWPVDTTVEQIFEKLLCVRLQARQVDSIPFIWFWPEGASSCVMMTHDVEAQAGARFCTKLMDIDQARGIPSSFQIVPEERYPVTDDWLESFRRRGFELNIQDLNHDGRLFDDRKEFLSRAKAINSYAAAYGARGFRAAAMYRNPDWLSALDISFDMSIPNTSRLEPQRGGCCTVFPYFVGEIVELPLTTTQDYSLFHILNDYSIDLWRRQIELIQEKRGLISFIVHPDYVLDARARKIYLALLDYLVQLRTSGPVWFALPSEVDNWWRQRAAMKLENRDGNWTIDGSGSERARVAFAELDGNRVRYRLAAPALAIDA